jgi:hypothetical protein
MRNCPICESSEREKKWRQTFLVPEKWTQPPYLDWCVCSDCGMIYADNPFITQDDYDVYYNERYGFGVEDAEARQRQKVRAEIANGFLPDKNALIVDFGGTGILTGHLKEYGFTNVMDVGAGDKLPNDIACLFAEHVLEHIYDLPAAMENIASHMKIGGMFMVDGPESTGISEKSIMPMLDWHQKHINHFTFYDYLHLAKLHGFEFVGGGNYIERGNPCMQIVFGRNVWDRVATASLKHIQPKMDEMVNRLKMLGKQDVVVWGCGDVALHILSQYMPNIKYFVDKDPAFKGARISGRLVFDCVAKNEPSSIVVIAQSQREAILNNIRDEGLTNEVIII